MTNHIGFTGTQHGMSPKQHDRVIELLDDDLALDGFTAHHGDGLGADAQFHAICRAQRGGPVHIVIHPSTHRPRAFCSGDETHEALLPHVRNAALVDHSLVMIAAPFKNTPQPRGGTWAMIRLAIRALHEGWLQELYIVGRAGTLLDHRRWT